MAPLIKAKYAFSVFWAPVLVLGIILVAGELLTGRYRFLSGTAVIVVVVLIITLETYTLYEERHLRFAHALFATVLFVTLATALELFGVFHLIQLLLAEDENIHGAELLASGAYFWTSNVLVFGLWYWLIDRGGPHARSVNHPKPPDFFFPETAAGVQAQWMPGLTEYMYLAFTNATAFSPTDTLPLSGRARAFMTAESIISLVVIALVTARAVNILK